MGILQFLQKKYLGGTHAIRSNLFACFSAKRISTTIVAAMHAYKFIPFMTNVAHPLINKKRGKKFLSLSKVIIQI